MAFLVLLVRVVFWLLVVRFVLRLAAAALRGMGVAGTPAPAARRTAPPGAAVDLVRDHVCNTFVPRARALRAVVDGHEEHFCSPACRDQARAAHA